MSTRTLRTLLLATMLLQASSAMAFKRAGGGQRPSRGGVNGQTAPQGTVQIEVMVIRASNGTSGIAAPLRDLSELARPPFSVYTQMDLVSRQTLPLSTTPAQVALPGGGSLQVTSQGPVSNARYEVTVTIRVGGRTNTAQFSATPGDPFFTVRSTGQANALILGFIVH